MALFNANIFGWPTFNSGKTVRGGGSAGRKRSHWKPYRHPSEVERKITVPAEAVKKESDIVREAERIVREYEQVVRDMQRQLSEPAMLEEVDPAKAPTFDAVESEKALETAKKLTEIRKEKQAEVARAQVELDHAHRSLAQAIANEEEAVALAVMVMLA